MAKDTTRDKIWHATLQYAPVWADKPLEDRRNRYGFTAQELIDSHDLSASEKTVTDCLMTMSSYGYLRQTSSGRGGHPTTFAYE